MSAIREARSRSKGRQRSGAIRSVRQIYTTLTGGVLLAMGVGGASYATILSPVDSSGVIHGCYTNGSLGGAHAFVLENSDRTCPRGTTAISWNEQKPAGATGATGATGAAGPAGPSTAGQSGIDAETVFAHATGSASLPTHCRGSAAPA